MNSNQPAAQETYGDSAATSQGQANPNQHHDNRADAGSQSNGTRADHYLGTAGAATATGLVSLSPSVQPGHADLSLFP